MPFITNPTGNIYYPGESLGHSGFVITQDGGATGANFGIFEVNNGGLDYSAPISEFTLANCEFDSYLQMFLNALTRIKEITKDKKILVACHSYPGPTDSTTKSATYTNGKNNDWKNIDIQTLANELRCPVFTVNDLFAWGAYMLTPQAENANNFQQFHHGNPEGVIQFLEGPGGGLNGSLILPDGPIEVERGHIGLPEVSEGDFLYLAYLRAIKNGNPCWEDAISGPGLADMYTFELNKESIKQAFLSNFDNPHSAIKGAVSNSKITSPVSSMNEWRSDKTEAIVKAVRNNSDPICLLAYKRYARYLGALVSDSIKATGAKKRALLAANIRYDADILPNFSSEFAKGFSYSRKLDPTFVNNVPVDIVIDKHAASKGMAWCAANYHYLEARTKTGYANQLSDRMKNCSVIRPYDPRGSGAINILSFNPQNP